MVRFIFFIMSNSNSPFTLADMRAYLQDELPERERKAMDEALLSDTLLAGAMEALEEKLSREAIDDASLDKLTTAFRAAQKARKQESKASSTVYISIPQIRRYAAIVVIFLAVGWLLPRYIGGEASPQELFAENFQPYEDVISARSGAEGDEWLKEAMEHYNAQAYEDALAGFDKVIQSDPGAAFAMLYAAISAMKMEQSQQAISYLQALEALNNPILKDVGSWYLALAYLQKEDKAQAEKLLEQLAEGSSAYQDQAADLLDRLR